ncbi:MAG: hypothetical protein KDA90_17100 [Planctomycetaceae bacterium]|nr:hypothetical protein [Planctomycetaceae bacterium]
MPELLALLDVSRSLSWISPSALLTFLVIGPMLVAAILLLFPVDRGARRCGIMSLLAVGLAIGLLFQNTPDLDRDGPLRSAFLAGSTNAPNHTGFVWTGQPDLQPVHAFLIILTMVSLWTLPASESHRQRVAALLGLLAMSLLLCVADDVTSLLTATAGTILLLWLRMRNLGLDSRPSDQFLRWQLGAWICLMLGLAGLIGGMSLVRSAPHSAPSATGFLLSDDLLQIPRVCLQHPAALAVWEQWRGWALLPLLAACLLWTGSFPFHAWTRQLPANLPLDVRLWINCFLTKIPLLLLSQLIAPVYLGSSELLVLWLGIPVLLGLLLTAAAFVSAPVTAERFRLWPILWGNQLALWLLIQTGFTTMGAAPLILALMGAANMLWILGSLPCHSRCASNLTWRRLSLWIAALMLGSVSVLAWPFSSYDQALTPLRTGTLFDTLAPLGIALATLVMVVRLLPALAEHNPLGSSPTEPSATGDGT